MVEIREYTIVTSDGEVVRHGKAEVLPEPPQGCLRMLGVLPPNAPSYWDGEVFILKPPPPSAHHIFDYTTKQWEDPRGVKELQAEYLAAVEKEKVVRKAAPIFYEGHLVDAHTTAQTNITNKLNELNAIEALGLSAESIALYWRVADNSSVEFDSLASMKAWLLGLVAAISRRTTEIYSWSWTQKEKIRSSTSKEELEALEGSE